MTNEPIRTGAQHLDVQEFRAAVPPPRPIKLSHEHLEALEQRTMKAVARNARRRQMAATTGPALVVAACLGAVVLGVLSSMTRTPSDLQQAARPTAASPAAVSALRQVATVAAAQPAPTVSDDDYVYVRSVSTDNEAELGTPPKLGAPHEREVWWSQAPAASNDNDDVLYEFGQEWPMAYGLPSPAGPHRPTYAWLESLPEDPDEVLTMLENELLYSDAQDDSHEVFVALDSLIREQLLPPDTAATLYRAATKIPGVVFEPGARDVLGRQGIGIGHVDEAADSSLVWIFDTHEYLGSNVYFVGPDHSRTLYGSSAVVEKAVVSDRLKRPGEHDA